MTPASRSNEPSPLAEPQTEQTRIYSWRRERLERLGYTTADAVELALTTVDLHQLEQLIRQGCARDLARRICA